MGRGRAHAWVGAILLVAACTRASERPPLANTTVPPGVPGVIDAAPPDASPACIDACVQRRMMEATSMEHIRATCAEACRTGGR